MEAARAAGGELKTCCGCNKPIEDQYRLTVSPPDLEWHVACLLCCHCEAPLEECGTCFMKDGLPYCRKDYIQLFGINCAGCEGQVQPNDLVMRTKNQLFHTQCFKCSICDCKLLPGDQFGISNGKLLCRADLDNLCDGVRSPTDTGSGSEGSGSGNVAPKVSSIKRLNSEKGPRVRTVLTEQQLQTLRTIYATNPRPDALLKEHLVELTGLSSRVIRVWFQNKRCKDKKRAIQQAEASRLQQQTPVTPDGLGQISPHPGMPSFSYSPNSYDMGPAVPQTPCSVSPVVTCYQHNPAWVNSPTNTVSPFHGFTSSLVSDHQEFLCSTVHSSQSNHFAF